MISPHSLVCRLAGLVWFALQHTATMTVDVFSVPVFLVVFRESLETVIIVSVLLAFLKQTLDGPKRDVAVYKKLVRQVNRCRPLHLSSPFL